MIRYFAGLIAAFGFGCSLGPFEDIPADATVNECSEDSDCGKGGLCQDGACRAAQGTFSTLLFEVTVPTNAQLLSGVQFLHRIDGLDVSGGELTLALGHVASITGQVIATRAADQETCDYGFLTSDNPPATVKGAGGTIPAKVTFTPAERFLGLAATNYTVELPAVNETEHSYGFFLRIPPGEYHIYVQPGEQVSGACALPPQVFRRQIIAPGDLNPLTITLSPPEPLTLTVRWPSNACDDCATLDKWTIDVVDPLSGRVVSTRAELKDQDSTLTLPETPEDPTYREYIVKLALSTVIGETTTPGSELIRLSPPQGMAAPIVLLERRAVDLFTRGDGVINQFTQLPAVIDVEGQVAVAGSARGTRATVTLIAKQIDNVQTGTPASYVRTVESDTSGNFQVKLLPGTYRVQAVPAGEVTLAATEIEWEIGAMPEKQAGKLIELSESVLITGSVRHPSGDGSIVGTNVQAVPSPIAVQVLDRALGAVPFVPRASSAVTDEEGAFELRADSGTFDISVQPGPLTGFAWLVRPNVVIEVTKSLGPLSLPLPVPYRATVTSADAGPLGGALIRAFLYLDAEKTYTTVPADARSLLQIAESRARADGTFELLIPARAATAD